MCQNSTLLFFDWLQLNSEQIKLIRVYIRRSVGHQVLRLGRLREGDHFADRLLASEQRYDAIDAEGDAAMRRRSVGQRIEEEAEAAAPLLLAEAQHLEYAILQLLLVDSDAARAQFDAVQHQVVSFRAHGQAHFIGGVFEF